MDIDHPPSRKRIIFVDDDKNLLDGLRRSLHRRSHEWEMVFLSVPTDALALQEHSPANVVICDIKMPGMGGIELLECLKDKHPQTIRVIFSGEISEDITLKSLQVANQFLTKPCSNEVLEAAIASLLALQDELGDGLLKQQISRLDHLPSLPQNFWALKKEIEDPNSSAEKISGVIAKDMAMTTKLLQVANSASFGYSQERIVDPSRAVVMLGLDVIGKLAFAVHVFDSCDPTRIPAGFDTEALWKHSLAVSKLATKIARKEDCDKRLVDSCALAGLLHAIGKLVFAACLPGEYSQVLKVKTKTIDQELALERQVFGTTHPIVGAFFAGIWGLPRTVVDAIAYHHHLKRIHDEEGLTPLRVVHIANTLVDDIRIRGDYERSMAFMEEHELKHRLPLWLELKECLK